ncbi:hypothetical protein [Celeribacter litoreus]|uniref:hypothetical protein n=1 Tax=Celeribacter litoreus TaxID=2876714 RepID=UPI001CCF724A|nr:hypothetical protein [Celeribacter litoreus]MCA0045103.1 hypothetical protein [Celeribacter litoreus]
MTSSKRVSVAFAMVVGLSTVGAVAEVTPGFDEQSPTVVKTSAGKGSARFDWLNQGKSAPVQQASVSPSLGVGSWICSPSGFGSKSKCFRR